MMQNAMLCLLEVSSALAEQQSILRVPGSLQALPSERLCLEEVSK